MTSVIERQDDQELRLRQLEEASRIKKGGKEKKFSIKIPSFLTRSAGKEPNVAAALVLGADHKAEFKKAEYRDGLIWVGDMAYGFEQSTIYTIKKVPFILIYSWRTLAVGGETEKLNTISLNSDEKEREAKQLAITNYAHLILVRRLEQAVLDAKKKGGGMAIIWWVVLAGLAIYVISQFFG